MNAVTFSSRRRAQVALVVDPGPSPDPSELVFLVSAPDSTYHLLMPAFIGPICTT